jgi:hypothetical protein
MHSRVRSNGVSALDAHLMAGSLHSMHVQLATSCTAAQRPDSILRGSRCHIPEDIGSAPLGILEWVVQPGLGHSLEAVNEGLCFIWLSVRDFDEVFTR